MVVFLKAHTGFNCGQDRSGGRRKEHAEDRQQLFREDPTGCSHHEKHCDLIEQWSELREAAHFSCIFLRKNKTTPNSALTLSLPHSIRQGETAPVLPTSRIFHDTSRFPPIILSSARPTHEIHTALRSKSLKCITTYSVLNSTVFTSVMWTQEKHQAIFIVQLQ